MKNKPLVSLLAFSTLFFAMLLPPEAYPNGKMAVVICATFVVETIGHLHEAVAPW